MDWSEGAETNNEMRFACNTCRPCGVRIAVGMERPDDPSGVQQTSAQSNPFGQSSSDMEPSGPAAGGAACSSAPARLHRVHAAIDTPTSIDNAATRSRRQKKKSGVGRRCCRRRRWNPMANRGGCCRQRCTHQSNTDTPTRLHAAPSSWDNGTAVRPIVLPSQCTCGTTKT